MQDIKSTTEKKGPASRAISMAMRIRQYGAERIAQYGRSSLAGNVAVSDVVRSWF
jgi:hypothetical protein